MFKNKLYLYGNEDGRVPAHLHFGKEMFSKMLEYKDITALINTETNEGITYGELAQRTADIAVSLARMGVKKGDVVSVCSEKRFEVIPSIVGILCAGAIYSPSDPTYGSLPLLHRLKISRPKVMFCSETAYQAHKSTFKETGCIEQYIIYDNIHNGVGSTREEENTIPFGDFLHDPVDVKEFMPVPVDGWVDNMFIVFSSGTTGLPKGVPVTHLSLLLNHQCFISNTYKGMRILNTGEWYFSYGLMFTLASLMAGVTIVYTPTNTEENVLKAIQNYKVVAMQMIPTYIIKLVKSDILDNYDLSSVKTIVSASTPVNGELIDAMKKRLPNIEILQLYGMSEGGFICSEFDAPKGTKPGSSGVPSLGFVIKVVDLETRKPLGPNHRGEICLKGPCIIHRYLNNACPDFKDEEGFLKTGDIGYYDEDGYIFVVNRIKELIKFNDVSIAPAEFETILLKHPAVHDVGVVGIKHPQYGEAPVAFVVLQPGANVSEQELVDYLNSRVTFRMRLAGGVRFVEQLPRGGGDKLNRQALRQMLEN